MKINVFFLYGAVESFGVGIHLGAPRVGVPVDFMEAANFIIKMFHEFRSIVGKDKGERKGEKERDQIKEFFCGR